MRYSITMLTLAVEAVSAFPFVANLPGVNTDMLNSARQFRKRQQPQPGSAAACPYNAHHVPAVGISKQFPYGNAANGLPGSGVGGYQVPAPGDKDHQYQAAGPNDIRGPCPGLNAAANHGFIARDGITTFNELVDAQQNVWNVGWDLAVALAISGVTLTDGDPISQKLSIGCDATSRTSIAPLLTGAQPGLDGHNRFESDSSLTRNDYFLAGGDNFSWNSTLFGMFVKSTGGNFDRNGMAKYRYERYMQSKAENPNFYFGPITLLIFGAASFLYELFPSGPDYKPDVPTISSFFGATSDGHGGWKWSGGERIPPNWTNRVQPYTLADVVVEILAQYTAYPVLFGGNTGDGTFDTIDFGAIQDGKLNTAQPREVACLIYMLLSEFTSDNLNGVITPTAASLSLLISKLNPTFSNFGCPLKLVT